MQKVHPTSVTVVESVLCCVTEADGVFCVTVSGPGLLDKVRCVWQAELREADSELLEMVVASS